MATGRDWPFQPTDQAAAFMPTWDLLPKVFFWPGLTGSAACYPFPVADKGERSQVLTNSVAHLLTNVKWKHWSKTKCVKCTQMDKGMLDGINLGELKQQGCCNCT